MHPNLQWAGALPSLDMPHHLRSDEECAFREGIAVGTRKGPGDSVSTMVDCGLKQRVTVPVELEQNTRVTVRIEEGSNGITAEATSPDTPREEMGYYWGFSVRQAPSLSGIFTECPYSGGYDTSIGTSERGVALSSVLDEENRMVVEPKWTHLIIVFGGVAGLEAALAADAELLSAGVGQASEVFDHWVNLVPGQGSRTIRTEEAVWVGLTGLRPMIETRDAMA